MAAFVSFLFFIEVYVIYSVHVHNTVAPLVCIYVCIDVRSHRFSSITRHYEVLTIGPCWLDTGPFHELGQTQVHGGVDRNVHRGALSSKASLCPSGCEKGGRCPASACVVGFL